MLKVVHVITRMDMGGSAQNTLQSCKGLAGKYQIDLLYGPSLESRMTDKERAAVETGMENARLAGVNFQVLSPLVRKIDPLRDLKTLFCLMGYFKRQKPDIVHTHSSKAGLIGRWAAWLTGVPHIIHTPHGHVFFGHFGRLASFIFLLMERITDLITDCTVALTKGERNDYLQLAVSRAEKLEVIHSGVNIEKFENLQVGAGSKKRSIGIELEDKAAGTVGWLLPIKGPDILLQAMGRVWKEYPEVRLVYVGKGELEGQLKSGALKMGASDKVKFLGWREDIPELMKTFDIFVLPSRNEGMGRVLVEAMASGLATVGTRVGGIPDLIKDGYNGYLVKPEDPEGLADAIQKLLADEQLRNQMGERGRKIAKGYTVEAMVQKIDNLYLRVLSQK